MSAALHIAGQVVVGLLIWTAISIAFVSLTVGLPTWIRERRRAVASKHRVQSWTRAWWSL